MTFHIVQVIRGKPWCASVEYDLMACEGKMSVEAMRKAAERGKCRRGHMIDVIDVSGGENRVVSS